MQEEILDFWFGPIRDGFTTTSREKLWYVSSPETDAAIRERFGAVLERALALCREGIGNGDDRTYALSERHALLSPPQRGPRAGEHGRGGGLPSGRPALRPVDAGLPAPARVASRTRRQDVARSKSKNKIKRHRWNVKRKRRLLRKKKAAQEAG